jgi:hypothetical protein
MKNFLWIELIEGFQATWLCEDYLSGLMRIPRPSTVSPTSCPWIGVGSPTHPIPRSEPGAKCWVVKLNQTSRAVQHRSISHPLVESMVNGLDEDLSFWMGSFDTANPSGI